MVESSTANINEQHRSSCDITHFIQGVAKKPIGLLHVKVLRAEKLLKMNLLSASDPYVKLSLSGERLPAKKTSIKMNNLNPGWNGDFKLTKKDPQT